MAWIKRISLFLLINFLVVLMISVILNLLNVKPYLTSYGINYSSLLIFCLVWGIGGAFISLSLSRKMAKWMMGVKLIDPATQNGEEKWLLELIEKLAKQAKLPKTPEVGIYSSKDVNAFATGPTKRRSLVALSSSLLEKMDKGEIEAIIGHELSHIANGDMVTMTLLQGIVNAFVMFLARVLAFFLTNMNKRRSSYLSYMMFVFLFEVVFMLLGSLVLAAYSRFREYRADRGSAYLVGKEKMISALQALQSVQKAPTEKQSPAFQHLKIRSYPKKGLLSLFATHPPLEKRIARLDSLEKKEAVSS